MKSIKLCPAESSVSKSKPKKQQTKNKKGHKGDLVGGIGVVMPI